MEPHDSEKPGFSVPIRAQIGKSGKSKEKRAPAGSSLSIVKSSDERVTEVLVRKTKELEKIL